MKQLMFYEKPVAIDKKRHLDYRVEATGRDYLFAKNTNSVLLTGMEFSLAAKEYAIAFAKAEEDRIIPLALLGLRKDENLFLAEDGKWDASYIPAFVRRYPFVLAEGGKLGELVVCIDEGFAGFNRNTGTPLFDENGEQSALMQNAVKFLSEYQGQFQRTEVFVNRLRDLDILAELTARAELADGAKITMGGLLAVDEKKLLEMDKKKALELFRAGELGWIYAHLLSLSNLNRLAERLGEKNQAATSGKITAVS